MMHFIDDPDSVNSDFFFVNSDFMENMAETNAVAIQAPKFLGTAT